MKIVYFQYSKYYKYAQRTKGTHDYRNEGKYDDSVLSNRNINKKTENSEKNQMEIIELKSIATEMMNLVEWFNRFELTEGNLLIDE